MPTITWIGRQKPSRSSEKSRSPYVKILFDIYHVQIMEGNLIETIRKNIRDIAHFHVGDVPGRHEPGQARSTMATSSRRFARRDSRISSRWNMFLRRMR